MDKGEHLSRCVLYCMAVSASSNQQASDLCSVQASQHPQQQRETVLFLLQDRLGLRILALMSCATTAARVLLLLSRLSKTTKCTIGTRQRTKRRL
jgi:hypothetical protein